ncbi:hypothetical protein [Marinicrinis lubricantis]|uniref:Uncharacterized protein n=1 Tax=Marinicrinis lubricantis TaxID=2086470 RepID=A0ABW1IIV7_9BACL
MTTANELQTFLENHFSMLDTSLGTIHFIFSIHEKETNQDVNDWIEVFYDTPVFFDIKYNDKISSSVKEQVKQQLQDHMERLVKAVMDTMPDTKLSGAYTDPWSRYPPLRTDYDTLRYYHWSNYAYRKRQS